MAIEHRISAQYVSFDNPQYLSRTQKQQAWDNIDISAAISKYVTKDENGNTIIIGGGDQHECVISETFTATSGRGLIKNDEVITAGTDITTVIRRMLQYDQYTPGSVNQVVVLTNPTQLTYSTTVNVDDANYATAGSTWPTSASVTKAYFTLNDGRWTDDTQGFVAYKYRWSVGNKAGQWSDPISLVNTSYAAYHDTGIEVPVPGDTYDSIDGYGDSYKIKLEVSATDGRTGITGSTTKQLSKTINTKYPYYLGVATNESDITADYIKSSYSKKEYNISSPLTYTFDCGDGKFMWLCYEHRSNTFSCMQNDSTPVTSEWQAAKTITLFGTSYDLRIYNQEATNNNKMTFTL